MIHRVEGIVIRGTDYGEGSRIITLFAKETGKTSFVARGAKKVKSRHGAVVQMFTYGQYVFYRSGQLGTLHYGETIRSFQRLRDDLNKAAYGAYLAEMVDRLCGDGEPHPLLFEQLLAAYSALEEDKDADIIARIFEMKMLQLAGYAPVLDRCVLCGNETDLSALSPEKGGVLCRLCLHQDPSGVPLSVQTLQLLRLFNHFDLRRLGQVQVKPSTREQLKQGLKQFMDTHLNMRWKSRDFIEQMEKYQI